ncbi:DUF1883 domain-containing protein [Desulfogranum marinum]|uniref:DUF1883 domain-containing protein n=1 Tax=Desulfogranum marinum TaxID=453220 RepID=UPI001965071D|nr:DUF1883 domain-containing protein [Desulfogranum marinum]MBM9514870.1 DUF1883 domain-containing protein [Desulfogranum marinum]
MKFTQYNLGYCKGGEIIEVTLKGSAANVRLMDSSNFNNFKSGRQHRYAGGLIKRSPYRVQVPRAGNWYITVDMAGLKGTVRSSIRQVQGALPSANQSPLSSVPSLVREPAPSIDSEDKDFDVFISHASEDKDDVVRPLAHSLKNGGLSVWYDEFELSIGDSLRRQIDKGVSKSRFGVVVFSKHFLSKGWTNYELDGIVTKSVGGEQIILPIWHEITKKEIIDFSPSLADRLARSTSTHTVEEIADEIVNLIKK